MDGKGQHGMESVLLTEVERKSSTEHISVAQLQQLVRLLDNSEVSEIEVRRAASGMRLVIRKARAGRDANAFFHLGTGCGGRGSCSCRDKAYDCCPSGWHLP